jgi:general secretion pathway protein H
MLVVLAIVGLMGSIAVLGLGGGGGKGGVEAEARRLAGAIQDVADEAIVSDRALALSWDVEGYSFVQWDAGQQAWQAHRAPEFGLRHDLPDDIALGGPASEGPVRIDPKGAGATPAFIVSNPSSSWQVRFDGLNVLAGPAGRG